MRPLEIITTLAAALIGITALAFLPRSIRGLLRSLLPLTHALPPLLARARVTTATPRGEQILLSGEVVALDLLTSPLSDREGVYLRWARERLQRSNTGIGAGWVVVEHEEEVAPFELRGEASILVDPEGGQFLVSSRRLPREGEGERAVEAILKPGAELLAIGRVREEEGFEPSAGYRGVTSRLTISAGERGLLVGPPRQVRRHLLHRALLQGLWVALTVAPLLAATLYLGNRYPLVRLHLPEGAAAVEAPVTALSAPALLSYEVPRDARPVGQVRVEVWVPGLQVALFDGHRAGFHARQRLREALTRRGLDGVAGLEEHRQRRLVLFERISWTGVAYRFQTQGEAGCRDQPWCRPAVEQILPETPAGD